MVTVSVGPARVKSASEVSVAAVWLVEVIRMRALVLVAPLTVQAWLPSLGVEETRVDQVAPPSRESAILTRLVVLRPVEVQRMTWELLTGQLSPPLGVVTVSVGPVASPASPAKALRQTLVFA